MEVFKKLTPKEFLEKKEDRKIPIKWENEEFYILDYVLKLMEEYGDYCKKRQ